MRFHTLDSRKISFADYWHLSPIAFPFLSIAKLLRIPITLTPPQVAPSCFRDLVVEPSEFSADAIRAVTPLVEEAHALGFNTPLFQRLKNPFQPGDSGAVAMRSADGSTTLQIVWVRVSGAVTRDTCTFSFTSKMPDDTWLVTDKKSAGFAPLPWTNTHKRSGSLTKLWDLHRTRLAKESDRQPHISLANDTIWEIFLDELETRPVEHRIALGIYVPIANPALTAGASPGQPATVSPEHAAELHELHKLQTGQRSTMSKLVILGVSLGVFFGVGVHSWKLNHLLILIGVLVFHEAGHFLAMRLLGYRNVQMFFIPFLGAAVSGRHIAAAGWKKALVSLMGPLPGIIAGIGLTIWTLATWDLRFVPLATMLLVINAFNLAPLMPLDGGWFLHAILFGRNRWSEAAFRVITGVALAGGALLLHTRFLAFVGVMIAVSAGAAWHVATIARKLRGTIPPPLNDDDTVPDSVALQIVGELKAAMPKTKSPKTLAKLAMEVYDKVHAPRPSLLTSLGFGGVYAVTLAAALLFGCMAIGLKTDPQKMRTAWLQGLAQADTVKSSPEPELATAVSEDEPVSTPAATTAAFRMGASPVGTEAR